MINLIKNALKFTTEGQIQVKACYNDEAQCLVVHVLDTGAGIAREDIPRMFTQFGRLRNTADLNSEGIGLGLTISKLIVESSGGKISVESKGLNRGSLFILNLKMEVVPEPEIVLLPEIEAQISV